MVRAALTIFLFFPTLGYGQLSLDEAKAMAREHHYSDYRYHQKYEGHRGYSAPIILTDAGGAAFFTRNREADTYGLRVISADGETLWHLPLVPLHDELETQSLLQAPDGSFYAFVLSYNYRGYRGGVERVLRISAAGEVQWDITLGDYTLTNRPHSAYNRQLPEGTILMRGHIVLETPPEDEDPVYYAWQGWLNTAGELEKQEIDEPLEYGSEAYRAFFRIE